MKLQDIHEGIGFRSQLTKDQIDEIGSGGLSTFLSDNGTFVFRDKDAPEDFVKIEPLQKAQTLNVVPDDPRSLSTFEGSKIYYAYAVAASDDISMPQFADAPNNQELIDSVERIGKFDKMAQITKGLSDRQIQLRQIDVGSMVVSDEQREEIEQEVETLNQMKQVLQDHGVDSISKLKTIDKKAGGEEDKYRTRLLRNLRVALGHAIKAPRNKREQTLQRRIIQEAIKQFMRMNDTVYDLILYPKSSSTFGRQMAEALSGLYGSTATEIPKALGKDVQIYDQELLKRAQATQQTAPNTMPHMLPRMMILPKHQKYITSVTIPATGVPVQDPRWPELWAEKEANKLRDRLRLDKSPDKPPKMKSNEMGDKRRYAQLFQLPEGFSAEGLEVLIVDDNVHHSGTMESLNHMVKSGNPKKVDMFVPFWFRYPD